MLNIYAPWYQIKLATYYPCKRHRSHYTLFPDQQTVWTNAHGLELNLSYIPTVSVIVSLTSVLVNTAVALNVFAEDNWPLWVSFLVATVLGRLQVTCNHTVEGKTKVWPRPPLDIST